MPYIYSKDRNVKFTVIESDDKNIKNPDMEIIFQSNFIKHFLEYLNNLKEEEKTDEKIFLTRRERQVLIYLAKGYNNLQIAQILNISIHTVKVHIRNLFWKLQVQDRTEAVVKAIKGKLLVP